MPYLAAFKMLPWKLIGVGAAIMAFGLLFATLRLEQAHSAKLKVQVERCSDARKADRASYERAQTDAKAKNIAEVKAIEARQEQVNAETKSKYANDLARVRAGGVRQDLAAPSSPAGKPGASGVPQTTCRADDANLCVSRARIVQAAEIELSRNALIDWVERQSEAK